MIILETSPSLPKPICWLGMEKQNLAQQKHASFTNQNKHKINTKKTKAVIFYSWGVKADIARGP